MKGWILTSPCHECVLGYCSRENRNEARRSGAEILSSLITQCEMHSLYFCVTARRCKSLDGLPAGQAIHADDPVPEILLAKDLAGHCECGFCEHNVWFGNEPGAWREFCPQTRKKTP